MNSELPQPLPTGPSCHTYPERARPADPPRIWSWFQYLRTSLSRAFHKACRRRQQHCAMHRTGSPQFLRVKLWITDWS